MPEYRKEWFAKAKIDYFAPFVNLWLSCNAWYMDHYSELDKRDRTHIDKVKSDYSSRNHIYKQFKKLLDGDAKESQIFKSNIQQLHFALNDASIVSDDALGVISFESAIWTNIVVVINFHLIWRLSWIKNITQKYLTKYSRFYIINKPL